MFILEQKTLGYRIKIRFTFRNTKEYCFKARALDHDNSNHFLIFDHIFQVNWMLRNRFQHLHSSGPVDLLQLVLRHLPFVPKVFT